MSTQRRRGLHADLRKKGPKNKQTIEKNPGRQFPIQNEIRELEDELNAYNERIAELEDDVYGRTRDGRRAAGRSFDCNSRSFLLAERDRFHAARSGPADKQALQKCRIARQ